MVFLCQLVYTMVVVNTMLDVEEEEDGGVDVNVLGTQADSG